MNKKYFFITIGCYMNISDSERFASFLEKEGFVATKKREQADLVVINTCGVRQMAEDRVYGLAGEIKKRNPKTKIIITGCLSKRKDVMKKLIGKVDWFLPANDMFLIPSLLKGDDLDSVYSVDKYRLAKGEKYLKIVPKYENNYSAVVPIGNGCDNFCSYCVVPYARGREVYRPAKDILKEIKELIKSDYKEIILVAQNVNSYCDNDIKFPELLKRIIQIKGKFWIRFFSSHPKDMSQDLIETMASSDKVTNHLHLALQSGDDKILKLMNRKYTAAHFVELIARVRQEMPTIAISTDIIVGFCQETKAQFNNTVSVFKDIGFDMAYLAQYSPRPQTVSAEKMKDNVLPEEKKRRFDFLNEELKKIAIKKNKEYLGLELEVLIDGRDKKGRYFGKTSSFKTVHVISTKKIKIGDFAMVKIVKARAFSLEGELLK